MNRAIQVIYTPGTFGNCLRWMLDRFYKGTKFKGINSPWDEDGRVHGFMESDYNSKFLSAHQLRDHREPNPLAEKIVVSFLPNEFLFAVRCGFYRVPGWDNDGERYGQIMKEADQKFIRDTFGETSPSAHVAKELIKIQFHDRRNNKWWNAMENFLNNDKCYQFKVSNMWNHQLLVDELVSVSQKFDLDLDIDETVIQKVVEKIERLPAVITKDRAQQILQAIESNNNMPCHNLDVIEQAYIEVELEKRNDSIIFPYGVNWFKDTNQIVEFLKTYPSYLKHMNPRLPWYNNMENPFYLRGSIDKNAQTK